MWTATAGQFGPGRGEQGSGVVPESFVVIGPHAACISPVSTVPFA